MNVGQRFPILLRNVPLISRNKKQNVEKVRYAGVACLSTKCKLLELSTPLAVTHSPSKAALLLHPPDCTNYVSSFYFFGTSTEMTENEVKRAIEDISEKFSEAMELMNDARSSLGTVYFSDDVIDTQAQVEETLTDYKNLLSRLNEKQRKIVIQSIGLKMEELKAQMTLLEDLTKE